MWKHLPNALCCFRILAVPFFVYFLVAYDDTFGARVALGIYFVATITDIFDGRIARKYHLESDLGRVLDPLADKLLIIVGFLCPLYRGILPWWFVVITFVREIVITYISLEALYKHMIPKPNFLGKAKTVFQMATIVAILIFMAITNGLEWVDWWLLDYGEVTFLTVFVSWIVWTGLILSLISMVQYLKGYIDQKIEWRNERLAKERGAE